MTLRMPQSTHAKAENTSTQLGRDCVTSVCFLAPDGHHGFRKGPDSINDSASSSSDNDDDDDDDDDESDDSLVFRSAALAATLNHTATSESHLRGKHIVSLHGNGEALVWDLSSRSVVGKLPKRDGVGGLVVRRMGDEADHNTNVGANTSLNASLLYQTRDSQATVSVHDPLHDIATPVTQFKTESRTFCRASSCVGSRNLIALPSFEPSFVAIRDLRISPTALPVAYFDGSRTDSFKGSITKGKRMGGGIGGRGHGMLSSVAMCIGTTGQPVVSCGMESGTMFVHELVSTTSSPPERTKTRSRLDDAVTTRCFTSLCNDPILGLDMVPSGSSRGGGVLCAVGLAGDAADLRDSNSGGTVALIKASPSSSSSSLLLGSGSDSVLDEWKARIRGRVGTCSLDSGGKPGVSVVRFRDGGRVFAIGGWDKRVRLFDRTHQDQLMILKGHEEAVKDLDWCPGVDGLLVSCAGDGRINVWNVPTQS